MSFGNRLKTARQNKKMTQKELANIIGVKHNSISNWENDQNYPGPDTIELLCGLLDISPNYLLSGKTGDSPTLTEIRSSKASPPEVTYAVATWKREYQEHTDKYARLDDYGRKAVDALTEIELARVKYEQEELERVDYNNIITISKSDFAASAGTGIYLGPESFSQIKVCKNNLTKKAKFAVPVKGNSMNPDFYDGDILLVGEEQPKMGEFGIFTLDGEGYVKMLGDGILIPMNTNYPNIKMNDSIRCNGKVLGILNPEWIAQE